MKKEAILVEIKRFGSYHPSAIKHCLCPDGIRRRAELTAAGADTLYTWPARVCVKGRTVTGFVSSLVDGDYQFTPNSWGRNAFLFAPVEGVE